ncbi:MAG: hypothetical protein ACTSRU_19430 [Candidatus Hodarchaeales archaeon]
MIMEKDKIDMIAFTKYDLVEFKNAYNTTLKDKQVQFTFKNHAYVVSYAKYVIEYLEDQFKTKG